MLDDQDDAHSAHSIGIVENPLYAEQEDYNTPSYAALKEKEAEVRGRLFWTTLHGTNLRDNAFSNLLYNLVWPKGWGEIRIGCQINRVALGGGGGGDRTARLA